MSHFDERRRLLQLCTVRLTSAGGQATGVFVAPGAILTCRHVATQLEIRQDSPTEILWRTETGRISLSAVLDSLAADPTVDLALLRVTSVVHEHPCIHILGDLGFGDEVYAYGFPEETDGDSVGLHYEGESTTDGSFLLKLKMGQADYGLSGSALLNRRTGSVCGIVSVSRDPQSSLGARAV
jgi:S1-C subfamily serine protease